MPDESTGIPGCDVELQGQGDVNMAKITSDAQGNFYITNLEPNGDTWGYRIVVKKDNWGESITQHFSVLENTSTIVAIRVYPYVGRMTMKSDGRSIEADGKSRTNLTVSLYDVNGQPVPDNMHIKLTQNAYYPDPGLFFAGADNGTEMVLPTKDGNVTLQYGGIPGDILDRSVQLQAESLESAGNSSIDLPINLTNPNIITGTIYDLTMRPVPNATVSLAKWNGATSYIGYNSTPGSNSSAGNSTADATGKYNFSVMPAGNYQVTASDSTFSNSTNVTLVRGTYRMDIVLPMNRGSIKGWVNDANGALVPGVKVTLYRVYAGKLSLTASNVSDDQGRFSFDDIWYGGYDVQAVLGDQTADVPMVLDVPKASAAVSLHKVYTPATPTPSATPAPSVSYVPTPQGNATGKTITPRPPTPTPYPVTPDNIVKTYGLGVLVIAAVCGGVLIAMLRLKPKA
ncbi:MAG TPA: carboxypeptidase-like regulatory domain-containing protein [Methanocella sp.]|nr:carboxypeptidase-like regulatory domain-containing protein [Methanocella sp.]